MNRKLDTGPRKRVVWGVRETGKEVIRAWFDPEVSPERVGPHDPDFDPAPIATEILRKNATQFGYRAGALEKRLEGPFRERTSVVWNQVHNGARVDGAQLVINLHAGGTPLTIFNRLVYGIPNAFGRRPRIEASDALELLEHYFGKLDVNFEEPELVIYRYHPEPSRIPDPDIEEFARVQKIAEALLLAEARTAKPRQPGELVLAWEIRVVKPDPPRRTWFARVDATKRRGGLLRFVPDCRFVTGRVFAPNPIVKSGRLDLTWSSQQVDSFAEQVTLQRLESAGALGNRHIRIIELSAPVSPPPTGSFEFAYDQRHFSAVMAYHHADLVCYHLVSKLGIDLGDEWNVAIDHAGNGTEARSYFSPSDGGIVLAAGGNIEGEDVVPHATDAEVIVHELAHYVAWTQNPSLAMYASGMEEGFPDFVAAVWFEEQRRLWSDLPRRLFLWSGQSRRFDWKSKFDSDEYVSGDPYRRGEIWASAMFDIYRALGGASTVESSRLRARDVVLELHIRALGSVGNTPGIHAMASQIEAENKLHARGLFGKVIFDRFLDRNVDSMVAPAVDLFVDGGNGGSYEWHEDYTLTTGIWSRRQAYPEDEQQYGSGTDHEEPAVDEVSKVYVRVKNRGTAVAAEFEVRLRSSDSAAASWPNGWSDVGQLSGPELLPGGATVVGPFDYSPNQHGRFVLAIVESSQDQALTQELPTEPFDVADLVRFDNNIAMRDLTP